MGRRVYGKSRRKGWLIGFIICFILAVLFLCGGLGPLLMMENFYNGATEYSATIRSISYENNEEGGYYRIELNEYDNLRLRIPSNYVADQEAMEGLTENAKIYFSLLSLTLEEYFDIWEEYPTIETTLGVCGLKTDAKEIVTRESYLDAQRPTFVNGAIWCSIVAGILFIVAGFFLYKYIKKFRQEKRLKMYRGENNLQ